MTGATDKAAWVDMTHSTPLEVARDVVHFSTKVSALFWILVIHDSSRDPESALTLANRLYEVNSKTVSINYKSYVKFRNPSSSPTSLAFLFSTARISPEPG